MHCKFCLFNCLFTVFCLVFFFSINGFVIEFLGCCQYSFCRKLNTGKIFHGHSKDSLVAHVLFHLHFRKNVKPRKEKPRGKGEGEVEIGFGFVVYKSITSPHLFHFFFQTKAQAERIDKCKYFH